MDYVLLVGAIGIILVVVFTVRNAKKAVTTELKAKEDHQRTLERGALPPSLHPKVNLETCIGSGTCIKVCPEKDVLGLIEGKAQLVNPTSCIGHGECLRACPVDAISLVLGTEKRGIDIPLLEKDFQTNVPGLYIVGELGGMGLIYNAMTQALQCMDSVKKSLGPKVDGVHQLAIVGAGPAGIAASVTALNDGLDFVTLDQESIGGTVLHYPRHKVVMTKPVELPGYGKVKVDTVEKEALLSVWEDIIKKTGLKIRTQTKVEGVQRTDNGHFLIKTAQDSFQAQRVILAMGRRGSPRKLGIPGEALGKVTYRLLEPENYRGKKCLVVGGGDSAVEAVIALGEAGAEAYIAHRRKIFDRIKGKNQERLDAAVEKGQVRLLLEASPKEIREDAVLMKIADASVEVPNDYVIVLIGGVLPTKFLESVGVEVRTYKGESFAPAN